MSRLKFDIKQEDQKASLEAHNKALEVVSFSLQTINGRLATVETMGQTLQKKQSIESFKIGASQISVAKKLEAYQEAEKTLNELISSLTKHRQCLIDAMKVDAMKDTNIKYNAEMPQQMVATAA